MSEMKYEVIDASSISVPVRRRKKKNVTVSDPMIAAVRLQQQNEDGYWKRESRELLALSRINKRRQIIKNGFYNEDLDPYAHLVDPRHEYEIEMESVFHCDSVDEKIEDVVENFLEEFESAFYEANSLDEDSPFDEIENCLDKIYKLRVIVDDLLVTHKEDLRLQDAREDLLDTYRYIGTL